jgi:hypothetical protein
MKAVFEANFLSGKRSLIISSIIYGIILLFSFIFKDFLTVTIVLQPFTLVLVYIPVFACIEVIQKNRFSGFFKQALTMPISRREYVKGVFCYNFIAILSGTLITIFYELIVFGYKYHDYGGGYFLIYQIASFLGLMIFAGFSIIILFDIIEKNALGNLIAAAIIMLPPQFLMFTMISGHIFIDIILKAIFIFAVAAILIILISFCVSLIISNRKEL